MTEAGDRVSGNPTGDAFRAPSSTAASAKPARAPEDAMGKASPAAPIGSSCGPENHRSQPDGDDAPPVARQSIVRVTVRDALRHGAASLRAAADNPRLEARLLLAHALGIGQNDLLRDPARPLDASRYHALLHRRQQHEPLAHIVGHREFWSLDFIVSPATLIPRPDTETLVEAALSAFAGRAPPQRILDLGTGTGCLLLALLTEFPAAFGIGVDIEPAAAALASGNARRLGLLERSAFLAASWTDALRGRFEMIVCNPPYIESAAIGSLMPDVAWHEPRRALDGGADGLDAYRALLRCLPAVLAPGGAAVLELGAGQANVVACLGADAGFTAILRRDLRGIPRAVALRRPNE